ncbi:putative G-protein coupled receptor Mth2 [Penaeus vannamei]|uniref:Putative G-protein coupled receptor Mth2 n=1 Tax=Penaeus vannamei TaxID=6689 RepID=A0A423SIC6_PENVA|nr:putative G-protein coupled receptor Mth2 [Penaeus vannamei]
MPLALWWLCAACACVVTATTTPPPQAPSPPPQPPAPNPQPPAPPPQPPASNPANLTLRKCLCGGGQAWDGAQCVGTEETPVAVLDHLSGRMLVFDSSSFGQVTTGPITCPDLREPAVLRAEDRVVMTTTGRAFWLDQRELFVEFCVEHTPKLEFRVCLHAPPIPRCCRPGYVLEKDGSCSPRDAVEFKPPVYLRATGEPLHFPDTNAVDAVEEVTCEGLAVPHRVDLSGGSDILLYNLNKAALAWLPPSEYARASEVTTSYCVGLEAGRSISEEKYVAVVCYTDLAKVHRLICANGTCVRKCCSADEIFTPHACLKAASAKEIWQPSLHFNESLTPEEEISDDLIVVSGLPLCKHIFDLKPDKNENDKHFLLGNGSLHVPAQGMYHADKYCLDLQLTSHGEELITILCAPTQENECEWKNVLILVLLCISCVFLFATLVVYVSVAELRDRTNGRCLISMVAAMLATYVSIAVNRESRDASDGECLTMGFIGHVCSLATFFWLNVMCFDMWSTLSLVSQNTHVPSSCSFYLFLKRVLFICSLLFSPSVLFISTLLVFSPHLFSPRVLFTSKLPVFSPHLFSPRVLSSCPPHVFSSPPNYPHSPPTYSHHVFSPSSLPTFFFSPANYSCSLPICSHHVFSSPPNYPHSPLPVLTTCSLLLSSPPVLFTSKLPVFSPHLFSLRVLSLVPQVIEAEIPKSEGIRLLQHLCLGLSSPHWLRGPHLRPRGTP